MIDTFKRHVKDRAWRESLILAFVLLGMSLIINFYSGTYATTVISNPVTDAILSNIPVFDVDWLFVYGAYFLIVCLFVIGFRHPERVPFMVKAIAIFYVIRSIFIMLTHIAPFPSHVIIDPLSVMRVFNFDGQLFFSGHVGLPFLMALTYWHNKKARYFFLVASVFFGVIVLLGHLHYSIDVFAAFFITYGIYHIVAFLFPHDHFRPRV